jgi:hypothetical protein
VRIVSASREVAPVLAVARLCAIDLPSPMVLYFSSSSGSLCARGVSTQVRGQREVDEPVGTLVLALVVLVALFLHLALVLALHLLEARVIAGQMADAARQFAVDTRLDRR